MKTKTLLLAVALAAAGAVSAVAQPVYSVNAVGFVNTTVAPGFSIICNPLNASDNTVGALFPLASTPVNATIFTFNGSSYSSNRRRATGWENPSQVLVPGLGFFFNNTATTNLVLTFVGEVVQSPDASTPVSIGLAAGNFQLVGSRVPMSGLVQNDLGLTLAPQETVFMFENDGVNTPQYVSFRKTATGWSGPSPAPLGASIQSQSGQPIVPVGTGFFLKTTTTTSWNKQFSVNQ